MERGLEVPDSQPACKGDGETTINITIIMTYNMEVGLPMDHKGIDPAELPSNANDPVSVALYGFIATSLLLTLDERGVFRALARQGWATPGVLADELGLERQALSRTLQGAECWGLVSRQGDSYGLSKLAAPLVDPSSETYCGPMLSHFRRNTVPLFGFLGQALNDGTAQWSRLADVQDDTRHAFSNIFESSEHAEAFHAAMWRLSYGPSAELVGKGVLENTRSLVDLGGGGGAFAIAAARQHQDLEVFVFDLPEVQPFCEKNIQKAELEGRVHFVAGDFWTDPLPPADIYALGYILSDWDDAKSVTLLHRVRQALPDSGQVLVLERLLEENRSGPFPGVMQDLAMMLETGGMHRTESHYRQLLEAAGFGGIQVFRSSGDKHAVVGKAQITGEQLITSHLPTTQNKVSEKEGADGIFRAL